MNKYNTWSLDSRNEQAAYSLLAAVRGPDAEDHLALQELKGIVTERVRGILFTYCETAGNWTIGVLEQDEVNKVRKICARLYRRNQQGHFLQHLKEAVIASASHPIWNGFASSLIAALDGNK